MPKFTQRLQHAWNAFRNNRDPTNQVSVGISSYDRPDRRRRRLFADKSIVTAIENRIAIDVAAVSIQHVRTDQNGRYMETIKSGMNDVFTVEANADQTGRAFVQDLVMSMFDEGVVAVVPVDTTLNPITTGGFDIQTARVAKITQWYPQHVMVEVYNEKTGKKEEIMLPKKMVLIIENPLYSVMNEPNSTLQRLIRKLNLLDSLDEQTSSGKLDLIIQLPYVIKSEARRQQAEARRKEIEMQLAGSKYGIAYTDGTEKITQLNRSVENNLLTQIEYLTKTLYSQLGFTEEVFNGTADEKTMLNYNNRTVEPILSAIVDETKRKWLTKTARTQNQSIMFFRDPFKLVPIDKIADIADKFTRNEILSANEMRGIVGFKPVQDPRADELRNSNLNQQPEQSFPVTGDQEADLPYEQDGLENIEPQEAVDDRPLSEIYVSEISP